MLLFALALLLPPCAPDALTVPSLVLHEVEFTGAPLTYRWGYLDGWVAGSDGDVSCPAACDTSPCTVLIPDPGERMVVFQVDGADDMTVGGKL